MKEDFTWGKIIDATLFNGNSIIKYHPRITKGVEITKEINTNEVRYRVEELSESFPTYNMAVIGIMVRQNLGLNNSNLVYAIGRMLKEIKNG